MDATVCPATEMMWLRTTLVFEIVKVGMASVMLVCVGTRPVRAVFVCVHWDDAQIWLGDLHFVLPLAVCGCCCMIATGSC